MSSAKPSSTYGHTLPTTMLLRSLAMWKAMKPRPTTRAPTTTPPLIMACDFFNFLSRDCRCRWTGRYRRCQFGHGEAPDWEKEVSTAEAAEEAAGTRKKYRMRMNGVLVGSRRSVNCARSEGYSENLSSRRHNCAASLGALLWEASFPQQREWESVSGNRGNPL